MTVKVGINGFGRMGRLVMRAAWDWQDVTIVHINEPAGDAASAYRDRRVPSRISEGRDRRSQGQPTDRNSRLLVDFGSREFAVRTYDLREQRIRNFADR